MGLRYKMNTIFVISTPNNPPPPEQNLRGFCEVQYLPCIYQNPVKMGLLYKMYTIFVFEKLGGGAPNANSANVINSYRENPDSPLWRRFHRERRGRAACISRSWLGHRHGRPHQA
ncbi:hypothetical protein Y032_0766g2171 [Ancylostoma ceylanicum]|uniref:Uncharacterized protein n=1 Tax=Ancylostoma ceylanicum TaxID=53326 RepID=A0A016WD57_9BILA|nr:hypothetical protein Y032_0766g2171 [Ancylostoma ceylanicum]